MAFREAEEDLLLAAAQTTQAVANAYAASGEQCTFQIMETVEEVDGADAAGAAAEKAMLGLEALIFEVLSKVELKSAKSREEVASAESRLVAARDAIEKEDRRCTYALAFGPLVILTPTLYSIAHKTAELERVLMVADEEAAGASRRENDAVELVIPCFKLSCRVQNVDYLLFLQFRGLEDVVKRIDSEAATVNPFAADAERLREALASGAARLGALCEEKARAAAEVDR